MHVPALNNTLKPVDNFWPILTGLPIIINIRDDFILQAICVIVKANDIPLRGNFPLLYDKWLKSEEL